MSDRVLHILSLVAALLIVGGGMYALLDKAAPIVETRAVPPPRAADHRPSPPAYVPPAVKQEPAPTPGAIYRCESKDGIIYSDAPCKGGRIVDVQVTRGFDSSRHPYQAASPVTAEAPQAPAQATAVGQSDARANPGLCRQIHEAIAAIDAAARAGGSAAYQDDLRERRRKLVEKRQELRC